MTLLDLTIREIIDHHPETVSVFRANGLGVFTTGDTHATVGAAVRHTA